jgi:hypothetical protein
MLAVQEQLTREVADAIGCTIEEAETAFLRALQDTKTPTAAVAKAVRSFASFSTGGKAVAFAFAKRDMRENKENHHKNIIKPLEDLGYKVDTTLVTNKHKRYDEFVEEYNAIRLDYSDITQQEYDNLYSFYSMKTPQQWGCGSFRPGGRFLKMRSKFPEYDLYVFLRGDTILKKSLNDMNVDYEKINYL